MLPPSWARSIRRLGRCAHAGQQSQQDERRRPARYAKPEPLANAVRLAMSRLSKSSPAVNAGLASLRSSHGGIQPSSRRPPPPPRYHPANKQHIWSRQGHLNKQAPPPATAGERGPCLTAGRGSAGVLQASGDSRNGAEDQVDEVGLLALAEFLLVVATTQGTQGAHLGH